MSNMRLTVKVSDRNRDLFFYDKGIRAVDDQFNQLSTMVEDIRPVEPRFLEDIISVYGASKVSVHEYGKHEPHRGMVETLLASLRS